MCEGTSDLISVVIGVYNEEDRIATTIQSLLGQTISNFEIIIVNDGSTDDTPNIINDFHDERIKIISLENNHGLPTALNHGIEIADGEYIARADADERSLPYRLQRQSEILDRQANTQAVGCWYTNTGRQGEQVVDTRIPTHRSFGVTDLLNNGPGVAHGSMMIRNEALSTVGGYREEFQLAQDYDLWLRMAEEYGEGWLHIVPEVLYERKIDVSQLQKRYRQRIYRDAAQESARARRNGLSDQNIINNLSINIQHVDDISYSEREIEGMYHYLVGTKLLEQNNTNIARKHLIKSLWFAPTQTRPWYRLGISLLRPNHRETIQDWIMNIIDTNCGN